MAEKPEFCFSRMLPHTIWKIVAVAENPVLVLELRDDEKRMVQLSAFNYQTNEFLWENISLTKSWWVSLAAADASNVYLRRFKNMENPDEIEGVTIDLNSGKVKTEQQINPAITDIPVDLLTPLQYTQGHAYFESVSSFLKNRFQLDAVRAIEYFEYSGMILISFYLADGAKLENHLLAVDDQGKVILKERLGEGLTGIGLGTFFVRHNKLFFVKDKRELVIYKL